MSLIELQDNLASWLPRVDFAGSKLGIFLFSIFIITQASINK